MYLELFSSCAGLTAGTAIGYSFGLLQAVAFRHNENLQRSGKPMTGFNVLPGSGGRVVLLLLLLVLIQIICPMLFRDGIQWWVSGGVGLGYGWTLLRQLALRRKGAKE